MLPGAGGWCWTYLGGCTGNTKMPSPAEERAINQLIKLQNQPGERAPGHKTNGVKRQDTKDHQKAKN